MKTPSHHLACVLRYALAFVWLGAWEQAVAAERPNLFERIGRSLFSAPTTTQRMRADREREEQRKRFEQRREQVQVPQQKQLQAQRSAGMPTRQIETVRTTHYYASTPSFTSRPMPSALSSPANPVQPSPSAAQLRTPYGTAYSPYETVSSPTSAPTPYTSSVYSAPTEPLIGRQVQTMATEVRAPSSRQVMTFPAPSRVLNGPSKSQLNDPIRRIPFGPDSRLQAAGAMTPTLNLNTTTVSSPTTLESTPLPSEIPTAVYLRPGRVSMPFEPYAVLNVEGMTSGALAKDPDSGRIFRVP